MDVVGDDGQGVWDAVMMNSFGDRQTSISFRPGPPRGEAPQNPSALSYPWVRGGCLVGAGAETGWLRSRGRTPQPHLRSHPGCRLPVLPLGLCQRDAPFASFHVQTGGSGVRAAAQSRCQKNRPKPRLDLSCQADQYPCGRGGADCATAAPAQAT